MLERVLEKPMEMIEGIFESEGGNLLVCCLPCLGAAPRHHASTPSRLLHPPRLHDYLSAAPDKEVLGLALQAKQTPVGAVSTCSKHPDTVAVFAPTATAHY